MISRQEGEGNRLRGTPLKFLYEEFWKGDNEI